MNENNTHPLTVERAAELWGAHAGGTVPWGDWFGGSSRALISLLRAAFDAGQKYQDDLEDDTIRNIMKDVHHLRVERDDAVARAERAEDRLSDSVHVDEAARRVEAAREQAWDEAARKALDGGWIDSGDYADLRAWNPHRPAQEPPEWTGAIIEGAGGGRIQATAEGVTYTAAEAIYRDGMWYGAWRTARGGTGIQFSSSSITPGTWRTADDPR